MLSQTSLLRTQLTLRELQAAADIEPSSPRAIDQPTTSTKASLCSSCPVETLSSDEPSGNELSLWQ